MIQEEIVKCDFCSSEIVHSEHHIRVLFPLGEDAPGSYVIARMTKAFISMKAVDDFCGFKCLKDHCIMKETQEKLKENEPGG